MVRSLRGSGVKGLRKNVNFKVQEIPYWVRKENIRMCRVDFEGCHMK